MAESQSLLARLLKTPDLATVVPRLHPEILHRVVQTCGLEDCAEFVALATPGQLAHLLDLDLWRVRTPGTDEAIDAERFGLWITVLMEAGAGVAAEKLAGLDIDLIVAGLVRHAAVFDHAAIASYTTLDGELVPGRSMDGSLAAEIGGYVIAARRTSAWDAIVELLAFLGAEHPAYFHRLMRECVRLSDGRREEDGVHDLLEDDEQDTFDLAVDREARRERLGYVAPAQAHAFLQGARDLQPDAGRPAPSPIARAYLRALESTMESTPDEDGEVAEGNDDEPTGAKGVPAEAIERSATIEVLSEAGVLMPQPRALLAGGDVPSSDLSLIQAHVGSHAHAAGELAFLANAIIAGCAIQGRPFTAAEASDAAAATCNLGLENWPARWADPDVITAFQVGWTVLHRDVCLYAAQQLIEVLADIRCRDRDIQLRLNGLRHELTQAVRDRQPWRARAALDVIVMLDAPCWAALLALIDECPAIHAALNASRQRRRTIDPADFSFISQSRQIAVVREFLASLPSLLTR